MFSQLGLADELKNRNNLVLNCDQDIYILYIINQHE